MVAGGGGGEGFWFGGCARGLKWFEWLMLGVSVVWGLFRKLYDAGVERTLPVVYGGLVFSRLDVVFRGVLNQPDVTRSP